MKKIEKSPAVFEYECEKCLERFSTEVEAVDCEKSHVAATGLTSTKFKHDTKYPISINVRMNDGEIRTYELKHGLIEDILHNVTSDGETLIAVVDGYTVIVQKEYVKDDTTVEEKITGANVKLENRKLYVDIPDDVEVSSTDNICVKVIDEAGNEVTAESENSIFDEIVIIAEVKQVVENKCVVPENTPEDTPEATE